MPKSMIDLFCEMVRMDSESGSEARFVEHMRGVLAEELGAETLLDAHGNLIARVPPRGTSVSTPIMLVSHADTVKPGVGIEPIIDDGVVRSSGETILGADDKAGIAEIIEAVRRAERRPPVEVVLTLGEETGLSGSRNLDLDKVAARTAFILDAEELEEVIIGGPTYVSLDIEIHGRASHAGMYPEKGISAIRVAAHAICTMPEGRIDPETTANLGVIEGGLVRNGVPDTVRIKGECRSLDHNKAMRQAAAMRQAFEDAAAAAEATVTIEETLSLRAAQISSDTEVVTRAAAALRAEGIEPSIKVITGGTDALILTNRGVEAIALGVGVVDAHATTEHVKVADMQTMARVLVRLLEAYAAA